MNCPKCKTSELQPRELENYLLASVCLQCEGCLIPLMNYRYWVQNFQSIDNHNEVDSSIVIEEQKAIKSCPKCAKLMTKYSVSSSLNNHLELCAHCDEAWLDHGEWQLLKVLELQDKLPKIFTDSWQRSIRQQKNSQHFKNRYIELLGNEDFSKIDAFKQWLDQHDEKLAIKHYLSYEPLK